MPLVQVQNSETGEWTTIELSDEQLNAFNNINDEAVPQGKLHTYIENLNIPAEGKAILEKILNFTIKIGDMVINIGRKIIEIIVFLSKKFPNTLMGALIGFFIGALFSLIPILGSILGWLVMPLAIFVGATYGFKFDLDDKLIKNTVNSHIDELFGIFKTMQV